MVKSAKSYSETYLGVKIVADASQYQKTMLSAGKAGNTAFTPTQRAMSQLTTNTSKATTAMNALTKAGRDGIGAFQSLYTGSLPGDVIAFADSKLSVVEATKSEIAAQRELAEATVTAARQDLDSLKIQYQRIQANKEFYSQTNQMSRYHRELSELDKRDLDSTEALIAAENNLAAVRKQGWGKNLFNAMGGWVGVATLAASAAVYLSSQLKTSSERVNELADDVDKLSSNLDKLGQKGLDNAIFLLEQKLEQQKQVAQDLSMEAVLAEKRQQTLEGRTHSLVRRFNELVGATTRVKSEALSSAAALEQQNTKIDETTKAIDKANRLKLGLPDPSKLAADQVKALDKLKSQLEGLRTPIERNNEAFIESASILDQAYAKNLIPTKQYHERLELLQSEHNQAMAKLAGERSISLQDKIMEQYDPVSRLKNQHDSELAEINEYLTRRQLTEQQAAEARLASEQQYSESLKKLNNERNEQMLAGSSTIVNAMSQLSNQLIGSLEQIGNKTSSAYKIMFAASKALAIAQSIISTEMAANRAMAFQSIFGPVSAQQAASLIRGIGYASVGVIAGTSLGGIAHGGLSNVPDESTYLLQKGERVLSPNQNKDFTNFLRNSSTRNTSNINIPITIDGGSTTSENDVQSLAQMIRSAVLKVIVDERRPGGILNA